MAPTWPHARAHTFKWSLSSLCFHRLPWQRRNASAAAVLHQCVQGCSFHLPTSAFGSRLCSVRGSTQGFIPMLWYLCRWWGEKKAKDCTNTGRVSLFTSRENYRVTTCPRATQFISWYTCFHQDNDTTKHQCKYENMSSVGVERSHSCVVWWLFPKNASQTEIKVAVLGVTSFQILSVAHISKCDFSLFPPNLLSQCNCWICARGCALDALLLLRVITVASFGFH